MALANKILDVALAKNPQISMNLNLFHWMEVK